MVPESEMLCDRPDDGAFGENCGRVLEPCTGKAIESSEIRGMFCGILEDKNAESNVDNGGLACKLQGEAKTLLELCDYSIKTHGIATFCALLGQWMLVS